MAFEFQSGEVWERDDVRVRVVDKRVEEPTPVYLAPVRLQVEAVDGFDAPFPVEEGVTEALASSDTLLQEWERVEE